MKRLVNLCPPRINGSASPVAISSYACASGSGSSAVFVVVPTSSSSVAFGAAAKSFSAVVIVFSVLMVNPYYAISVVSFVAICDLRFAIAIAIAFVFAFRCQASSSPRIKRVIILASWQATTPTRGAIRPAPGTGAVSPSPQK